MKSADILLADDHPIFIHGLKSIIEKLSDHRVVYECQQGDHAFELIKTQRPTIAILDHDMPGMTGIEVVRQLNNLEIPVKAIMLTIYANRNLLQEAVSLGVAGYVMKDHAVEDIVSCIDMVLQGKRYISPHISHLLIQSADSGEIHDQINRLSKTEQEVLRMIADGLSSSQIADRLFIAEKTVKNHRHNICGKLGLHGTNSLLKYALENKTRILGT